MMYKYVAFILTVGALLNLTACSEAEKTTPKEEVDTKISKINVPEGFVVQHLYSPFEADSSSWVSMTFDDNGRLIVSDQYGALYRVEVSPIAADSVITEVKKLAYTFQDSTGKDSLQMGYAQGLLWAHNSLYVMVNNHVNDKFKRPSGLYRLQDTNNDDTFDKIDFLKAMKGNGEHGPHSVVLGPDGESIYVISGNHTDLPEMDHYRLPKTWARDNLFPLIKDPQGHANDRHAPGGWIAKTDSIGSHWELVSAGYRNAFDLTFNEEGELFVYDSDMEWDIGMPWYRPTRICHAISGSEFGWRTGNGKWPAENPDNLPPVINIGQGSPTNLIYAKDAYFPDKYRYSLLASDWSFGIIYSIKLNPKGSSYEAEAEEFLSGAPLPLTDGVIGPDGALYFMTGGRRLESDLYRVYHKDYEKIKNKKGSAEEKGTEGDIIRRKIRKEIEQYHVEAGQEAVDFVWPYLANNDRFIRYAARVAVEHQPLALWKERALKEKNAQARIQALIALARVGKEDVRPSLLRSLSAIKISNLSESLQFDYLRAVELALTRFGVPDQPQKAQMLAYLSPHYPAESNLLNRQYSKILAYLEDSTVIQKTLAMLPEAKDDSVGKKLVSESSDLIFRNPQYGLDIAGMLEKTPPAQQIYLATVISQDKAGWTDALRNDYFKWYYNAFQYKGGNSYIGFIDKARKYALANVPKEKYEEYNTLSGDSLLNETGKRLAKGEGPKGPGKAWKVDDALKVVDSSKTERNFKQGAIMFAAINCQTCHTMNGEGGSAGPDLTRLGTRFSVRDMLESIIEPSKVISDQYGAKVFYLKDGTSIFGKLVNENKNTYFVSQNPYAPRVLKEIPVKDVLNVKESEVSVMPPGLINSLNAEELKDLIAYLMAGGQEDHEVYKTAD